MILHALSTFGSLLPLFRLFLIEITNLTWMEMEISLFNQIAVATPNSELSVDSINWSLKIKDSNICIFEPSTTITSIHAANSRNTATCPSPPPRCIPPSTTNRHSSVSLHTTSPSQTAATTTSFHLIPRQKKTTTQQVHHQPSPYIPHLLWTRLFAHSLSKHNFACLVALPNTLKPQEQSREEGNQKKQTGIKVEDLVRAKDD